MRWGSDNRAVRQQQTENIPDSRVRFLRWHFLLNFSHSRQSTFLLLSSELLHIEKSLVVDRLAQSRCDRPQWDHCWLLTTLCACARAQSRYSRSHLSISSRTSTSAYCGEDDWMLLIKIVKTWIIDIITFQFSILLRELKSRRMWMGWDGEDVYVRVDAMSDLKWFRVLEWASQKNIKFNSGWNL